jgi:hypothetical protein
MEFPLDVFVAFVLCCFPTMGCLIAHARRRPLLEGMALGLLLGPIGAAIEFVLPARARRRVGRGVGRHSFRLILAYQARSARFEYACRAGLAPRTASPKIHVRFVGRGHLGDVPDECRLMLEDRSASRLQIPAEVATR